MIMLRNCKATLKPLILWERLYLADIWKLFMQARATLLSGLPKETLSRSTRLLSAGVTNQYSTEFALLDRADIQQRLCQYPSSGAAATVNPPVFCNIVRILKRMVQLRRPCLLCTPPHSLSHRHQLLLQASIPTDWNGAASGSIGLLAAMWSILLSAKTGEDCPGAVLAGLEIAEEQEVVVQSPFKQAPKAPWNIPTSVAATAGKIEGGSKPTVCAGGPLSPVKPLPRASRLRGAGQKRKARS